EVLEANPTHPAHLVAMWVAIALGVVIYGLTRSRRLNSYLMLDIGLIFEVMGAFCIGLIEGAYSSALAPVHFRPSGIALWITLFVLVVPNTLGKTALAA